jgi:hypothetical protein
MATPGTTTTITTTITITTITVGVIGTATPVFTAPCIAAGGVSPTHAGTTGDRISGIQGSELAWALGGTTIGGRHTSTRGGGRLDTTLGGAPFGLTIQVGTTTTIPTGRPRATRE